MMLRDQNGNLAIEPNEVAHILLEQFTLNNLSAIDAFIINDMEKNWYRSYDNIVSEAQIYEQLGSYSNFSALEPNGISWF